MTATATYGRSDAQTSGEQGIPNSFRFRCDDCQEGPCGPTASVLYELAEIPQFAPDVAAPGH
jgi:hypothetical protein